MKALRMKSHKKYDNRNFGHKAAFVFKWQFNAFTFYFQSEYELTLFLIFLALFAYLSVFSVSMKSRSEGLTQAIIRVRLKKRKNICTKLYESAIVSTKICMWSEDFMYIYFFKEISFTSTKPQLKRQKILARSNSLLSYLFPPRESWSNRVSLESLYGTWFPRFVLSPSALITLPRDS